MYALAIRKIVSNLGLWAWPAAGSTKTLFCKWSLLVDNEMRLPMSSSAAVSTAAMKATTACTMESTATVESTRTMGAAPEARVPVRRKASGISASGPASVKRVAMIEISAVVIGVVAIDDRAAVGDIGVVVVSRAVTVPIIIPVMPAPPKSSEKTDSKSAAEVN